MKLEANSPLPFADHAFDAIYAESVLGITTETILPVLLREILRVLTPGGTFITNDAIWKDEVSDEEIEKINTACLYDFGMIQSLRRPARRSEWESALVEAGFRMKKVMEINLQEAAIQQPIASPFQYYKKISSLLNVPWQFRAFRFNQALEKNHQTDYQYLISYLFVTQNPQHRAG